MNIIIGIILAIIWLFVKFKDDQKVLAEKRKRQELHHKKVKFIQSLSSYEREAIFFKNNACCFICGKKVKLNFYIESQNPTEWEKKDVKIICSECKGYSINFYYDRVVPFHTKQLVNTRDNFVCVYCGSDSDLHYDHIIPFTYGGASADADNIQLLCNKCNLKKHTDF